MKCDKKLLACILAEFLGSAMLLGIGCMGVYEFSLAFPIANASNLQIGLTFGVAMMAGIQSFACVSGAHINPCITIAAIVLKYIKWDLGLVYIVSQFLGAIGGYALIYIATICPHKEHCCTVRHSEVTIRDTIIIEYFFTAILIFSVCAAWHEANKELTDSLCIRIGLVVGGLNIAGGHFTGASMNPARTLAPAIITMTFHDIWIYMIIPPISAIITALAWKFLYIASDKSSSTEAAE